MITCYSVAMIPWYNQLVSIAESHNTAERSGPLAQESCNSKHKVSLAQTKINEIVTQPKKIEYMNLEGQKTGTIINDWA